MDFKYIKNQDSEVATMLLYDDIGTSVDEAGNLVFGIDGSSFAAEMLYLQDRSSRIEVRINSVGGLVMDGYSIISAILSSRVPVHTFIDGLAASIAGVIAIAGEVVHIMDYGTLMVHNPSGGDQKVLDLIKTTLITIFDKRSNVSREEMDKMMEVETFLTAEESLSLGLVDRIIDSGKPVRMPQTNSLNEMRLMYNKLLKPKNMDLITNKLGLKNSASEEAVVESIEKLQGENTELLDENKDLKEMLDKSNSEKEAAEAKLAEIAEKEADAKEAAIEELVNKHYDEGRINEEEKETYRKFANVDFEGTKNSLVKIGKKTPVKISNTIKDEESKGGEDRSEWTVKDWRKKDSEGLANKKAENPAWYTELYNKTYKVNN